MPYLIYFACLLVDLKFHDRHRRQQRLFQGKGQVAWSWPAQQQQGRATTCDRVMTAMFASWRLLSLLIRRLGRAVGSVETPIIIYEMRQTTHPFLFPPFAMMHENTQVQTKVTAAQRAINES